MTRAIYRGICIALFLFVPVSQLFCQVISQKIIDDKVREMAQYLKDAQHFNGSYSYMMRFRVGTTALVVLSLRTAGVPQDDPVITSAVNYINSNQSRNTYEEGLVLLALETVDYKTYKKRMQYAVDFLQGGQGKNGGWGYSNSGGNDESCSQYAILGLVAAERCGFIIRERVKERARTFYHNSQKSNGGWSYRQSPVATLSMTCAGLSSLALLGERVEKVLPKCGTYLENKRLLKGLNFLAAELPKFIRQRNSGKWRFYALYGLERTGIYLQLKTIGGWDWYKLGCLNILSDNNWKQNVVDAAFALLFITKNDAPYAITKMKWKGDWNNDHYDVANWVKEGALFAKKPLDWQTASLNSGLGRASRSSMIFINGHNKFKATHQELKALRQFLASGGVIVGEACCGSRVFYESFKRVMEKRLYPGTSLRFKNVPETHPILTNVYHLSPRSSGLQILGQGCTRKQIFLLKKDSSCAFNGDQLDKQKVKLSKALGMNILFYALGKRKPQKKFEDIVIEEEELLDVLTTKAKAGRGTVFQYENPIGRITYHGEWNTDPNFYNHIKGFLGKEQLPAFDGEVVVDPETDDIYGCAILFISGHGYPELSKKAMVNLRRYIQNGGVLIAEACCSDPEFNKGIHNVLKSMFPNRQLQRISRHDRLYSYPYDLKEYKLEATKRYMNKHENHRDWPYIYGISDGERWTVLYSPTDYTCAIEGDLEEDIEGLKMRSALMLFANMLCASMRLQPDILVETDKNRK